MSSRPDHRKRDRSWERDGRDRERGSGYPRSSRGGGADRYRDERPKRPSSRSRSPGRRGYREGDRDRRGGGGGGDRRDRDRDYKPHRDDDRRDTRDRGDRRERDDDRHYKDRDDRKDPHKRDDRDIPSAHDERRPRDNEGSDKPSTAAGSSSKPGLEAQGSSSSTRPNLDPDAPDHAEDGEAMDDTNEEEAAMMAMMGVAGFGSTKGKHVTGNQEGSVNIKKVRTWRQYMNRRGGFNRPLDKIK